MVGSHRVVVKISKDSRMKLAEKIIIELVEHMCTYRIFRTVWQNFPRNMQDATIAGTTKVVEKVLKSKVAEIQTEIRSYTEIHPTCSEKISKVISFQILEE